MKAAGALCSCGSPDVLNMGPCPIKHDRRPWFMCGSCGAEWTSGTNGEPYVRFAGKPSAAQQEAFDSRHRPDDDGGEPDWLRESIGMMRKFDNQRAKNRLKKKGKRDAKVRLPKVPKWRNQA